MTAYPQWYESTATTQVTAETVGAANAGSTIAAVEFWLYNDKEMALGATTMIGYLLAVEAWDGASWVKSGPAILGNRWVEVSITDQDDTGDPGNVTEQLTSYTPLGGGATQLVDDIPAGCGRKIAVRVVVPLGASESTPAWRIVLDTVVATGSIGRHAVFVPASAMRPSAAGGCAVLAVIASAANQPDIVSLDFDSAADEYAQFALAMPKSWDEGTVSFRPIWSHAATAVDFGVVWSLQALAVSDDDAIAQAFGGAETSADTGGTTDDLYTGPESSVITIAGAPAAEDTVFFRIGRVTGDAADTLAIDARLHGIVLYINTASETDD